MTPTQQPVAADLTADIAIVDKLLARLCDKGLVSMSIPVRQDDEDMALVRVIDAAKKFAALGSAPATPVPDEDVRVGNHERNLSAQAFALRAPMTRIAGISPGVLERAAKRSIQHAAATPVPAPTPGEAHER